MLSKASASDLSNVGTGYSRRLLECHIKFYKFYKFYNFIEFIEKYCGQHAHEYTVLDNVHINIGNSKIMNISVPIYCNHYIM